VSYYFKSIFVLILEIHLLYYFVKYPTLEMKTDSYRLVLELLGFGKIHKHLLMEYWSNNLESECCYWI